MKITIVNGFFLPVPPLLGGATEKSWYQLAREFAARGHEVVSISRRWPRLPDDETSGGLRHLRLPGGDHHRSLPRNLLQDFLWSLRVYRRLPAADIVVCNAVTLPLWLGRFRPKAGRVVVMCGRMPKGQYRRYSHLARVLAPSTFVRDRVLAENPALAPLTRVTGYPVNWSLFSEPRPLRPEPAEISIGYIGRIHVEKGLLLLAEALRLVNQRPGLPPWKFVMCGPSDVAHGGSGAEFRAQLLLHLSQSMHPGRVHVLDPEFNERTLAGLYRGMDIFCYPSLAEQGETFGVGVAEAMAAGVVPVVSDLACFRDFVRPGANGLVFNHTAPDAVVQLAGALEKLLRDAGERARLAAAAREEIRRFDFPSFADRLLEDFARLARS
jgi:glycosyltransferase involved in cell wall biosynthesis